MNRLKTVEWMPDFEDADHRDGRFYLRAPAQLWDRRDEREPVMQLSEEEIEAQRCVEGRWFGYVCIVGLGLGYSLLCALRRPETRSVTVYEKHPAVYDLVWRHLAAPVLAAANGRKVRVVHGDLRLRPRRDEKFDCIYVDVWTAPGDGPLDVPAHADRLRAASQRPGGWTEYWRKP